jgi:hypothetical protein
MRNDPRLRMPTPLRPGPDGWLGTPELPGYRAGNVVARLDDLPRVDPDHFYFDLLLLDSSGHMQDNHSGPCHALTRQRSPDERSRFVRVVAELLRHAGDDPNALAALGLPLTVLREHGVEADRLVLAAQLLDDACGEPAVVASLIQMLELSLGVDEAPRALGEVVSALSRRSGWHGYRAPHHPHPAGVSDVDTGRINEGGLPLQVPYIVRTVGKTHARRFLRDVMAFDLLPLPDMLGV